MGWRDFNAKIIAEKPIAPVSNRMVLVAIFGTIFGLFGFLMLMKFGNNVIFTYAAIAFGVIFVFALARSAMGVDEVSEEGIGTFSLFDEKIIIDYKAEDRGEEHFDIKDITYLNVILDVDMFSGAVPFMMSNTATGSIDLLENAEHHRFHFVIENYQQRENLSNICNNWRKKGYKVNVI